MRWRDLRRSENVEDQRRVTPAGIALGGGIGTVLLVVLAMVMGVDPRELMQAVPAQQAPANAPADGAPADPRQDEAKDFVSAILASTEDVWTDLFQKVGKTYEKPMLRLFSGQVSTEGCGFASAAVGPFYCPADQRVYLDLSFFDELRSRFKAPGEFAQAYVIAHEIGHHIQNLLGISEKFDRERRQLSEKDANALSVRMELQADFLAGVWAHHAQAMQNILERGDVEAGLQAATAIGDDKIQKMSRGYVVPDAFTHGSSEQRVRWFRKGIQSGDMNQGDTFNADPL